MKKLFSSLFLFLCLSLVANAVPAYRGLLTRTQSDGSVVNYYLRGDESFNFCMTEDGYLIIANENGDFEYAELNEQSNIVPVGIRVSNINDRTAKEKRFVKNALKVSELEIELKQIATKARKLAKSNVPVKRYPLKGSPTSLVILVNFADVSFTSPTAKEDFTALLNEKNYSENKATGSARDFFTASSNGIFSPNFVVVGPYTLPKEMAYYGTDYGVAGSSSRNERYSGQMIIDACKLADPDVDFSEYDTDGNGYVDNVFVYYAGYNQAEGAPENTVWPHRSIIVSNNNLDGVLLKDYACTSELKGKEGTTMCGIGTFCHEFGHVLGLPDFYVTDYSHKVPTTGRWDAMDEGPYNNGGKTPPSYSSYERFFLGWLTPTILEEGEFELEPLVTSNKAYILAKTTPNLNGARPDPVEFFMIENRQRVGWDSIGLPATGLLITHIDWSDSRWSNNTVNNDSIDMGVKIVCADKDTRSPAFNTFPGSSRITSCYLQMKDGYKFPEPITTIKQLSNKNISFVYGKTPTSPYISRNSDITVFETDFGSFVEKELVLEGQNITGGKVTLQFELGINYKLARKGDDEYSSILTLEVGDDLSFKDTVLIKFTPRKITTGEYITDKLLVKAENYEVFYVCEGVSNKPVNVYTPEILEATDITSNSFVANWVEQNKATCYYISIYSISDDNYSDVEKFATFGEGNMPLGWSANFTATNNLYKSSAPLSLYFKNDTDTLWTKEFFMPVDEVSVWVHSNNTIGKLYIDGFINGVWTNVMTEDITTAVRKKVVSAKLDGRYCKQFKVYYTKTSESTGGLCLDDFTATSYKCPNFVFDSYEVYNSGFKVVNLVNDKPYFYRVQASDKNLDLDEDKNETISAYSTPMRVQLIGYVGVDNINETNSDLLISHTNEGVLVDFGVRPSPQAKLYIYSADGRLVQTINPNEQQVIYLENLLENNIYVLNYSEQGDATQVTKIGKVIF